MSVAIPKCYVRLTEPIPGIDHIKYVDHCAFAEAHHDIDMVAEQLGTDRINDFYVYSGEHGSDPARWHAAADGVAAFRAVREYIENHELFARAHRGSVLTVLAQLESLLSEADCRDIRFCVLGNY